MPPSPRHHALATAIDAIEVGDFAAALPPCRALLADAPDDADASLLLGLALAALGETEAAAEALGHVAEGRPHLPHPAPEAADLLRRRGQPVQAARQLAACLARSPADGMLRLACAEAWHDAGHASAARGDLEMAIGHFAAATGAMPEDAAAWSNLGILLKTVGRHGAARAAHDRAVALRPEDARLRLNRAVALLHAGDMAAAWDDYEWRLRQPGGMRLPPGDLLPDLHAGSDLRGRTVLLWHEEGFGDTLQFIRYAPLVAARGARVVAWMPQALAALIAGVDGVDNVFTDAVALPAYDWHCPVFSLPRAFRTELGTIPADIPYLPVDPARRAAFADALPAPGRLRVGLAWAGQARPWAPGFAVLDGRRSMRLDDLAPLGEVPGIAWVCLQKDYAGPAPPGFDPRCWHNSMPLVRDFAETAAIVAELDVTVSVDTSVVHLAGGLGVPAFLLDRFDNCWRWYSGRTDSPWYPHLRIYRQARIGDWEPVVRAVAADLAARAAAMPRPRDGYSASCRAALAR
jgi:Flp pilus assembly protein TadD